MKIKKDPIGMFSKPAAQLNRPVKIIPHIREYGSGFVDRHELNKKPNMCGNSFGPGQRCHSTNIDEMNAMIGCRISTGLTQFEIRL